MIKTTKPLRLGDDLELYKAAHAVVNHIGMKERLRGEAYPETYTDPVTGTVCDNSVMIPVRLINELKKYLKG